MQFASPLSVLLLGSKPSTSNDLTGVTTGTSVPVRVTAYDNLSFFVIGAGTISGGTVLIEEASSPTYAGTWSQIATIDPTTVTGGAQTVYHTPPDNSFSYVRARISSDITGSGGAVSVTLRAN